MATKLDKATDRPSTVAPGDAPADTTDPNERASSVNPNTAAAAAAGFQTVNAAVPLPRRNAPRQAEGEPRTEVYEGERPDGTRVRVTRNIDTGETNVEEAGDGGTADARGAAAPDPDAEAKDVRAEADRRQAGRQGK